MLIDLDLSLHKAHVDSVNSYRTRMKRDPFTIYHDYVNKLMSQNVNLHEAVMAAFRLTSTVANGSMIEKTATIHWYAVNDDACNNACVTLEHDIQMSWKHGDLVAFVSPERVALYTKDSKTGDGFDLLPRFTRDRRNESNEELMQASCKAGCAVFSRLLRDEQDEE